MEKKINKKEKLSLQKKRKKKEERTETA